MKYLILFISNVLMNMSFAQIDSLKKNSLSLSVEVGMPTTIFLNNYSQNNNFTPGLFKPFSEYIPPYTLGLRVQNGSKYTIGLTYIYFDKSNSLENRIRGDVVNRFYYALMAEVGKTISIHKFSISPTVNLNYKLSGIEEVLVGYIQVGLKEPISQTFQYNSLGLGFGGAIKYNFLPNFYISTDLRFTHHFEENKPLGKPLGGVGDFYKNYRVNRDNITVSLNLGYQIKLRD